MKYEEKFRDVVDNMLRNGNCSEIGCNVCPFGNDGWKDCLALNEGRFKPTMPNARYPYLTNLCSEYLKGLCKVKPNKTLCDFRVEYDDDGDIETVILNGREFEPKRTHGSIHTRLNQMDDKIEKMREAMGHAQDAMAYSMFNVKKEDDTTTVKSLLSETMQVDMVKCNKCGISFYTPGIIYIYCPHCGRKIVTKSY